VVLISSWSLKRDTLKLAVPEKHWSL